MTEKKPASQVCALHLRKKPETRAAPAVCISTLHQRYF